MITAPTVTSKGTTWLQIQTTDDGEQLDRFYCHVAIWPKSNSSNVTILDSGDSWYPLDGSSFLASGLTTQTTYVVEAYAEYSNNPAIGETAEFTTN